MNPGAHIRPTPGVGQRPGQVALPPSIGLELDRGVRRPDARTLIGGSPRRMLRLSPSGGDAIERLLRGDARSTAARLLARRLIDSGIAHPRPRPHDARGLVTVVIPVRDRPRELARCLDALDPALPVTVVDDGSDDGAAIAAKIAVRDRVRLLRRSRCGGPAAARNAALPSVETELVAFLDSDCVPPRDWLDRLAGHFDDPAVGAVAPRVRPSPARASVTGRYLSARSPLDMGARPAAVHPGSRVAYLPSAALVVRRSALAAGFEEQLRYGEDVDLVWRIVRAGWTVRYDPATVVEHEEPASLRATLARRFHYGTSAAVICARHPRTLSAAALHAPTLAGVAMFATGRRRLAAALLVADALAESDGARRRGLPVSRAARRHLDTIARTLLALGAPAATLGMPLGLAICLRRGRRTALGLIALAALAEWRDRRPALDPLRWVALATLDEAAYALGVYRSCATARDGRALLPSLHGLPRFPQIIQMI